MAAVSGRDRLLELTVARLQKDLGYDYVAFHAQGPEGPQAAEAVAGSIAAPPRPEALRWAARLSAPLEASPDDAASELAVPVRAGGHALGVLVVSRGSSAPFDAEETSLLATLGGHLALALRRADSEAATEHIARQMATLYDLGLETAALQDLKALFTRATEESGRLIRADNTSVFRFNEGEEVLRFFTAWSREPSNVTRQPSFRLGEGIAGRVARDLLPLLVNDAEGHADFVARGKPVARILCVPLTHFDRERKTSVLYGVLNATRKPGSAPFSNDDLEYLTRFAGQLSIAVANSVAFTGERERSEQLALVNGVLRESAGMLSRERILELTVRRIREAFLHSLVAMLEPEVDSGLLRVAAAASAETRPAGWPETVAAEGPAQLALVEHRTIISTESAGPGFTPLVSGSRTALAVPIPSGEDVAAVLYVESPRAGAFDRGQVITLETLADGVGILLRTAELYEALESTNARLVELDRTKSELVNVVAHDFRAPWPPSSAGPSCSRASRTPTSGSVVRGPARSWPGRNAWRASWTERSRRPVLRPGISLSTSVWSTWRLACARPRSGFHRPQATRLSSTCRTSRFPAGRTVIGSPRSSRICSSNAVKYSPDGGEVRLAVRRQRESAVVSVADSGIGIDADGIGKLFRPFSRVHDRAATGIEGFGLGLSICERIARAHGGAFEVDSTPGRGRSSPSRCRCSVPRRSPGLRWSSWRPRTPGRGGRSDTWRRAWASRSTRPRTVSRPWKPRPAFGRQRSSSIGSFLGSAPKRSPIV